MIHILIFQINHSRYFNNNVIDNHHKIKHNNFNFEIIQITKISRSIKSLVM